MDDSGIFFALSVINHENDQMGLISHFFIRTTIDAEVLKISWLVVYLSQEQCLEIRFASYTDLPWNS